MKAFTISKNSLLLFVYAPIIISIIWGFASTSNGWDEKHLDMVFAVWPLISISFAFSAWIVIENILEKRKQGIALIAGLLYLLIIYLLYIQKLLPLKEPDIITKALFIIFFAGYSVLFISLFLEENFRIPIMTMIYNLELIIVISTSLMGYLLLFVGLAKLIYFVL